MKQRWKKAISAFLCVCMILGMVPALTVQAEAALKPYTYQPANIQLPQFVAPHVMYGKIQVKRFGPLHNKEIENGLSCRNYYSTAWQYWSQGASCELLMSPGCRLVAQTKMLVEAGIASSDVSVFNPDVYYQYLRSKGNYISGDEVGEKQGTYSTTAAGMIGYSGDPEKNQTSYRLIRCGEQKDSNKTILITTRAKACDDIMELLRDKNHDYFVMLYGESHVTYVGKEFSLAAGQPIVLDSSSSYSVSPDSIYKYKEKSDTQFTYIVCFERIKVCSHEHVSYDICADCGQCVGNYSVSPCVGTYRVIRPIALAYESPYRGTLLRPNTNSTIRLLDQEHQVDGSLENDGVAWYRTNIGEKTYYLPQTAVQKMPERTYTAYVTADMLAINDAPARSDIGQSTQIGRIPKGASCTVYPERLENGFVWVSYQGTDGYAYNKYLTTTPPGGSTPPAVPASALSITTNKTITLNYGGFCPVYGTVSAGVNKITKLSASLDGVQYVNYSPNTSVVKLVNSPVNKDLIGASLSVGSHTLVISATDSLGGSQVETVNITVKGTSVGTPEISYEDIDGGKRVTIRQTTAGATLYYYCYKLGNSNQSTTEPSVSFTVDATYDVTAYSQKGGATSAQASRQIFVKTLAQPEIDVQRNPSGASVTLRCEENASLYYSTDGVSYQPYYGTIQLTRSATVYAYAKQLGAVQSEVASAAVTVSAPDTPKASLFQTERIIAAGDPVSVQWNADDAAGSYTVRLYRGTQEAAGQVNVTGRTASFVLEEAGEYSVTVQAVNAIGVSGESTPVSVTAKPPVTVTFADYDGAVISAQQVHYGKDAVRPTAPSRRGYTFDGWNGAYAGVKADVTVTAAYTINTYTVKFYDADGSRMIDSQSVTFGSSADLTAPAARVTLRTGYILAGWRVEQADSDSDMDFTRVDSNMTLVAVTRWENQNLPIVAAVTGAEWNADHTGYRVTVRLNVADSDVLLANTKVVKIIAAAKTNEDKLLGVEVQTMNASAATVDGSYELFVACDRLADEIEVSVLGMEENGRTGTVLALTASAAPTISGSSGGWSEWSTERPTGVADNLVQSRTEYRYRDNTKETYSCGDPQVAGWTQWNTTTYWGPTVDNGYSPVYGSDTRSVQTNEDVVANGYTQYQYYAYAKSGSSKRHFCYYLVKNRPGETWWLDSTGWINQELTSVGTYAHNYPSNHAATTGCQCPVCTAGNGYKYFYNDKYYYWADTRWVPAQTATHYYYQDLQYTYHYYKWTPGNWTDWSAEAVSAIAGSRDVETRTVYRYMTETPVRDTSGVQRPVSGTLDASLGSLTGKAVTVMVYKERNSDPTQDQMEYVGQTILGEDNSYSFSFKTREEPSEETGDFIVALALEGTSNLLNIDTIDAPVPVYTVTFSDMDGHVIDTQTVSRGEDAQVPDAPVREGYTFVCWNGSAVNIQRNQELVAVYQPDICAVAYVDWVNDTIDLRTCRYGEPFSTPAAASAEGYTFKGWDAALNGTTTVSGNMVVTAVYEPKTYTVTFQDGDNNELSRQTVAYGQSARLPDCIAPEGMVFLGWDTSVAWWQVKSDMTVVPLLAYEQTAEMPISNLGTECYAEEAALTLSAESGASIFYTLDGTVPTTMSEEYTAPLELSETTEVRAIAVAADKNVSDVLDFYFEYAETTGDEPTTDWQDVGVYQVLAQPGKEITLQVKTADNPGLMGYLFKVECDRGVFYTDYDEQTGFACTAGSGFEEGAMLCYEYEDTGWQMLWFSPSASTEDGVLFTLHLKTAADAPSGTYPIKVSYSPANTITSEELEADIASVATLCGEAPVLLGDINGDGKNTTADVIRIARNVVGLTSLTTEQIAVADVTGDENVTNADVIRLARYLMGLTKLG